jgi:drug/metabolite transporter (DMT)-like permease
MIYVILCILGNVAIFLSFRSFKPLGINTLQAIVVNYTVCVITGVAFVSQDADATLSVHWHREWLGFAIFLGLLFIITFYMMALTTQRISVAVASIASKMSLVIPVIFSLLFLNRGVHNMGWINYAGIGLAMISIVLSTWPNKSHAVLPAKRIPLAQRFLLPAMVFICGGVIDTSLNFSNSRLIAREEQGIFPIFIFLVAAIAGFIYTIRSREHWHWKSLLGGIYLGIPNYFSVYFLLRALDAFQNNGALIFPGINMGIILSSSLMAFFLFRERLNFFNICGMFLAGLSLFCIFYGDPGI